MRKDTISRLALKRMCYILLRTWTEWLLNIRRHIKLAPSPQRLKQEKGKSREGEKGKTEVSQLVKTEEKECALFSIPWEESPLQRTLSRTYLAPKLETVDCETPHLFTSKTDKAGLRDLCRENCFAREDQETVWAFCTWGWMNLQLSQ